MGRGEESSPLEFLHNRGGPGCCVVDSRIEGLRDFVWDREPKNGDLQPFINFPVSEAKSLKLH